MAPPRRAALSFMPSKLAAEPDARVLVHAVDPDLEVHVRSRRPTRRALVSDEVAARDQLPAVDAGRIGVQVAVIGRIAMPVNDHEQVAVAHAARIEVRDAGVGGDDRAAIRAGDIEAGVDLVRIGARGVVHLEVKGRAAEALRYAPIAACRDGPLENSGATPRLLRLLGVLG